MYNQPNTTQVKMEKSVRTVKNPSGLKRGKYLNARQ